MPHYNSAPGPSGIAATAIQTPVMEAVASGDLAVFFDGIGMGKWKKPPSLQAITNNPPPYSAVETSGALRGSITVLNSSSSSAAVTAGLALGGFVAAWIDTSGVRVTAFNAAGDQILSAIKVVDASGVADLGVCAMPDGGFVLTWLNTTTQWRRFAPDCSTVTSGSTTGTGHPSVAALQDGGFALAFGVGTGLKFSRYNSANTVVQADIAVATLAGTVAGTSITGLYGGGFAIAACDTTTATAYRYNASGALQGSAIASGSVSSGYKVAIAGLIDGGFVTANGTSGVAPQFRRFNSSGVLQGVATDFGVGSNPVPAIIGTLDGGFAITNSLAATYRFSATSILLGAPIAPTLNSTGIGILADGGLVVIGTNGSSFAQVARYAGTAVTVVGAYTVGAAAGANATFESYGLQTMTVTYTPGNIKHTGGANPGQAAAIFGQQIQLRGLA